MIKLDRIRFSYGENTILANVTLSFSLGEFVAVLGPNGSGKTTLLRSIAGMLQPSKGKVLLHGKPIQQYNARALAQAMAWVPQSIHAEMAFPVLDTVLMGRHAYHRRFASDSQADIAMAYDALRETGAASYADKKITELSGGELQRVLTARALCQDTPILLLDEPVSNLDIRHQVDILDVLAKRAAEKKVLVICVLHDLNLAAHYAQRVILMHQGKIVADGSPEEVLTAQQLEDVYGIGLHPLQGPEGTVWIPQYNRHSY